jgi:S1-C subfamily serine protease
MDDDTLTPLPQPTPDSTPEPAATEPVAARRRPGRFAIGMATAALVAGVGGVGAGYAVGHRSGGTTATSANGGSQQATTSNGPGVQTIPGSGWGWSDGGGSGVPVPSDPYGGREFGDGAFGGSGSQSQGSQSTSTASASQIKGLVRIVTTMKYDGGEAAGTGMVLTSDGEVVTNHHVVAGATSVKVTVMSTGKTYVAKVVGSDAKDDVAVLQLTGASGLTTVTTDHDGVSVGDKVTAVGDANGTVSHLSAATGRITALKQSITTQTEGAATGERLTGLMEISADVISGDSGGATYDSQGEVVGMTTAASSGGTDVVGYAVPITKVLSIADDLDSGVTGARYVYGYPAFLGVGLTQSGTTVQGAYPGTAAARAGIQAGDRITAVGSTKVTTSTQLHNLIAKLAPGDRVSLTWTDTSGSSHTSTVTLGTGPVA